MKKRINNILIRLQDRNRIPRRWWYPIFPEKSSLPQDEWKRQN